MAIISLNLFFFFLILDCRHYRMDPTNIVSTTRIESRGLKMEKDDKLVRQ
jgi:hypothetical protein